MIGNFITYYYDHVFDVLFFGSLVIAGCLVALHIISALYYFAMAAEDSAEMVSDNMPEETIPAFLLGFSALTFQFYKNWHWSSRFALLLMLYAGIVVTTILFPIAVLIALPVGLLAWFVVSTRKRHMAAKKAVNAINGNNR